MNNGRITKRFFLLVFCFLSFLVILSAAAKKTYAAEEELDEILNYEITVDVNEDGTLDMTYKIDWKVLDSTSKGPLTWVMIGIPNEHYKSYEALSDTIDSMYYTTENDGDHLHIDFDRKYLEGEVVSFSFKLEQDYMYRMNFLREGETVYEFTPGWFDDIQVDHLTIRWNKDKAASWSPDCQTKDGYLTWETPLEKGEKYQVQIVYPNNAFSFDENKDIVKYNRRQTIFYVIEIVLVIGFAILVKKNNKFEEYSNFTTDKKKRIERSLIVYYSACRGCGAPRPEGNDNCPYCGRSLIKSQRKIKEKDIPKTEAELRKKVTDGTYRFAHADNTYLRVTVFYPAAPPATGWHFGRFHGGRSGGGSCACACACACAGGGRAGCSTKDFYNTNLKLAYFEMYKRKGSTNSGTYLQSSH